MQYAAGLKTEQSYNPLVKRQSELEMKMQIIFMRNGMEAHILRGAS